MRERVQEEEVLIYGHLQPQMEKNQPIPAPQPCQHNAHDLSGMGES